MPWRIYFYFYLAISVFSLLLQLSSIPSFKPYDWLVFIETVTSPIALYYFVFNRKMSTNLKSLVIWVFILLWAVTIVYYFLFSTDLKNQLSILSSNFELEKGEILRGFVINIPMFYVMYQLFIQKQSKKKTASKKKNRKS